MKNMKTNVSKFKLIGRATVFILKAQWINKCGIACVHGHTLNGRFSTVARLIDVEEVK